MAGVAGVVTLTYQFSTLGSWRRKMAELEGSLSYIGKPFPYNQTK